VRARVSHLWRHPIKGHGTEAVQRTVLAPGATMPGDRVWAIGHEASRIDRTAGEWVPCANFSRGAKSPELMAIRARLDEEEGILTLSHPRRPDLAVNPDLAGGAARLIEWVRPISDPNRAQPAFVTRARDRGMTDSDFPSISILNHASLTALSQRAGRPLEMERFRGNFWLEGLGPWQEFEWIGRDLQIGDAVLRVRERITRCKATTVNPATGRADADTLGLLDEGWGHQDFGVYAEVIEGGAIAVGDPAGPA
jgi:uncharacterized protein